MLKLNLTANGKSQKLILAYLQENASEELAHKINNGVTIQKDGKRLINKKDLNGFMSFANGEAKKLTDKGATSACIEDKVVYGWAVHYFEEDSIEGKLYNEDGKEYKYAPAQCRKVEKAVKTSPAPPTTVCKPQLNIFDMLSNEMPDQADKNDTVDPETGEIIRTTQTEHPEKVEHIVPFYFNYLEIKKQYINSLLFMRLGDFYEVFANDALTVANELNLTLTSRDVGLKERIPMAGIPYHTARTYFNKLISKNYIVAIIEDNEVKTLPEEDDDEPSEIEDLGVEEMRKFDGDIEEYDELPTVSKITEGVEIDDDSDMIAEDDLKSYFDKEALIDLFDVLGDKVDLI